MSDWLEQPVTHFEALIWIAFGVLGSFVSGFAKGWRKRRRA